MIAAVICVRNEEDVMTPSLTHMLEQGVERIYVIDDGSSDGTPEQLRTLDHVYPGRLRLSRREDPVYPQQALINSLAHSAWIDGAEWVIPFDADEFFFVPDGRTLAEALGALPASVRVVQCRYWAYHDWEHREPEPVPNQKVVYRPGPGVSVSFGNHYIEAELAPESVQFGPLEMCHLGRRSLPHFMTKVRDTYARYPTHFRDHPDPHVGWHIRHLAAASDEEMAVEWEQEQAVPTVYDPIPLRRPSPSAG